VAGAPIAKVGSKQRFGLSLSQSSPLTEAFSSKRAQRGLYIVLSIIAGASSSCFAARIRGHAERPRGLPSEPPIIGRVAPWGTWHHGATITRIAGDRPGERLVTFVSLPRSYFISI
jgi:hypothetical protein